MITYLLNMTLCALLLYVVYALLLERENMHGFKRAYLLISITFSIVVPLASLPVALTPTTANISTLSAGVGNITKAVEYQTLATEVIAPTTAETPVKSPVNYSLLFLYAYILITSLFLLRLLKNCWQVHTLGRKNALIDYHGAKIALINEKTVPYNFGRYIFINKEDYDNGRIADEIILHEWAHFHQKHSWDIVFIELLIVFGWFNPVFYLYRSKIRQNHEFLADNAVIQDNIELVPSYQSILINQISQNNYKRVTSNFNYLLTQKRIVMMTKITSKKRAWHIIIALIPVFIAASCTFSSQSTELEKKAELSEEILSIDTEQIITRGIGVSADLVSEYQTIVDKYLEKTITGSPGEPDKFFWKEAQLSKNDWTRLYVIYVQMDMNQQKAQKIRFGETHPYYDGRQASKIHQYDEWKRDNNCIVWIDGKKVDKSVLDSYNSTDFFAFHISGLTKTEKEFDFRIDYWTENGLKEFSKQVFEQPVTVGKLLEIEPNVQFIMEQNNEDFIYVSKNHGSYRGWIEVSIEIVDTDSGKMYYALSRGGGSSPLAHHRNKESGVDKAGDCNCD